MEAAKATLSYYSQEFGPYEYNHLTFVESAGTGIGMHAEASLITYSEGSARFEAIPKGKVDLPFAIVTHEMAHQWTVPFGFVEGAPVMTEGIAWYYGLMAIKHARGAEQQQKMLKMMRRPYPYEPIRRGEPLIRGLDPYMAYRKAPFALYTMNQHIGEEKVNNALRNLLQIHSQPGAPLATTLDLYKYLEDETPDSLRYLLHDLFKENTYWNLDVDKATAKEEDGRWEVLMEVTANKVQFDSAGVETKLPMKEWVEIGVFAADKSRRGKTSNPLYLQKHLIKAGKQSITIQVDEKPVLASIDPNHILDIEEREDDKNFHSIEMIE